MSSDPSITPEPSNPSDDELARIKKRAGKTVKEPYTKDTPELEQSVDVWLPYHFEVERVSNRALYDAGWADGFNKATVNNLGAGVATHNTQIQAVLDLHHETDVNPGNEYCVICRDYYPCATVRALLVPTSKENGE